MRAPQPSICYYTPKQQPNGTDVTTYQPPQSIPAGRSLFPTPTHQPMRQSRPEIPKFCTFIPSSSACRFVFTETVTIDSEACIRWALHLSLFCLHPSFFFLFFLSLLSSFLAEGLSFFLPPPPHHHYNHYFKKQTNKKPQRPLTLVHYTFKMKCSQFGWALACLFQLVSVCSPRTPK